MVPDERCAAGWRSPSAPRPATFTLSVGLHTAEIARSGANISGDGVAIAQAVADRAPAGEVWVTSTLRDLTAGSGLSFERREQLDVPLLGSSELDQLDRRRRLDPAHRVLAIDHVIVVVEDLDAAARRYHEQTGLASVSGGRHPGHGTANRIVPLGSSYIELMAVIDRVEADSSPLGSWVERRLRRRSANRPASLCLRTDDIEGAARRTGREPLLMRRTRPDGVGSNGGSWPWTRR